MRSRSAAPEGTKATEISDEYPVPIPAAASAAERYLRGEFLRALAHALRSPLAVTQGAMAELAEATPATTADNADDTRFLSEMARRNLRRIGRIAERLEWVSEIESGALTPRVERFDLAGMLREACSSLQREGVAVHVDAPTEPCWFEGDRSLLMRMVTIPLDNALHFARAQLSVSLRCEGDRALLQVEDDGPGFSTGEPAELFDRFRSAKERGAGSDLALGLSIARDYAGMHRGTIELGRSAQGGARCLISLPRAPDAEAR